MIYGYIRVSTVKQAALNDLEIYSKILNKINNEK